MTELLMKKYGVSALQTGCRKTPFRLGYTIIKVELGKASLVKTLTAVNSKNLINRCVKLGFELLTDPETRLIEKPSICHASYPGGRGTHHNLSDCIERISMSATTLKS